MEDAWLFPSISHSINSRHAGTKRKIYQNRKKKKYKYTLGNSIPPYAKLSLLLTISSKNYNSYPKISTKSAATVAFGRKVSEGYSFKKDSQFNSYFSIAMWCCSCSASQVCVFHSLALSYWIRWYCDIKLPLLSMIKLDSFNSRREKKKFSVFPFLGNV